MPKLVSDLLTTKEAAAYLNLHPSTLEKWRVYGGGPKYYRLRNKAIRYHRSDLDAFVSRGVTNEMGAHDEK
jgi:excisionase family DNA binding protein